MTLLRTDVAATLPLPLAVVNTTTILEAIRKRHPDYSWAFFVEMRIGTGYGKDAQQRLDAWTIHLWPSKFLFRVTYEIKASRSDFLNEIKQPLKRRAGLLLSNEFYFATPVGLVKEGELPIETGLIEVSDAGAKVRVAAPYRDTGAPSWRFVASLARRIDEMRLQ